MKKFIPTLCLAACVLLPVSALAEEELEFGINTWLSSGQTKWRHDASRLNTNYGVPTSELDYQNVDSSVTEVSAKKHLTNGNSLTFTFGTGAIDGGTLVDDDYLSASGAQNLGATQTGAHRFSRTHSDIDNSHLFYLGAEFLPRDLQLTNAALNLRVGLGIHYWQEEYKAFNLRSIECTLPNDKCYPVGTSTYSGTNVISNTVEWTGVGLGVEGLWTLTEQLRFQLDMTFYPYMNLVNEDIHHLRGDLSQDPSVRMTGNGFGYDLQAGVKMQLQRNFAVHLNYRLWERWVENQTITFYGANGGASSANLMDFKTRREGVTAGISLFF